MRSSLTVHALVRRAPVPDVIMRAQRDVNSFVRKLRSRWS